MDAREDDLNRTIGQMVGQLGEIQRRMDKIDVMNQEREQVAWNQREALRDKMEGFRQGFTEKLEGMWIELRNLKHDQRGSENKIDAAFALAKSSIDKLEKSLELKFTDCQTAITQHKVESSKEHKELKDTVDELLQIRMMAKGMKVLVIAAGAILGLVIAWASGLLRIFKGA